MYFFCFREKCGNIFNSFFGVCRNRILKRGRISGKIGKISGFFVFFFFGKFPLYFFVFEKNMEIYLILSPGFTGVRF